MLVKKAVQLAVLAAAMLWETRSDAASAAVKFCGRQLGEMMSRVCHAYNSPSWDVPTVVEQHGAAARRKRQLGIADECCTIGCTWEQLSEYCSISAYSESPLEELEAHMIADRSAEQDNTEVRASPAAVGSPRYGTTRPGATAGSTGPTGTSGTTGTTGTTGSTGTAGTTGARREVGRVRSRGYGRARGRRCWCRRKRRSGRRRTSLGNTGIVRSAVRAAPVVGTVSPLLTWGRTLNTDLPPAERDRFAYVVYT